MSAFRGSTAAPIVSPFGQGAAYWAGIGGWVYELSQIEVWDLGKELEGRVQSIGGSFGNAPFIGEVEFAIPAAVPARTVIRYGTVVAGRSVNGFERLKVVQWQTNSNQ